MGAFFMPAQRWRSWGKNALISFMEKVDRVRYVTEEEAGEAWSGFQKASEDKSHIDFDGKAWTVEKISKAKNDDVLVAECHEQQN